VVFPPVILAHRPLRCCRASDLNCLLIPVAFLDVLGRFLALHRQQLVRADRKNIAAKLIKISLSILCSTQAPAPCEKYYQYTLCVRLSRMTVREELMY
jgi:hypothetical protein